jgi:hypothetical protein
MPVIQRTKQTMDNSNTARRVIRGLTLSLGIIAAAVAYAAVITPILLKIIGDRKHLNDEPIDVAWTETNGHDAEVTH